MKSRNLLATATTGTGEVLSLYERSGDFMIVIGRNELMTTRMSGSEEALAEMTIDRIENQTSPHLLIGGYGMGFTLRAALGRIGSHANVRVVELLPEIIEWARGPTSELTNGCLDDRRTALVIGDVGQVITAAEKKYDAILLDVDNGPDALTQASNHRLYSAAGLRAAKAALKPRGILAIWSAAPDIKFKRRLEDAGFDVDERSVRARSNGKGPRFVIWFARAP